MPCHACLPALQMRHPYTDYDFDKMAEMGNSHFLLRSIITSTELKGQMVPTQITREGG